MGRKLRLLRAGGYIRLTGELRKIDEEGRPVFGAAYFVIIEHMWWATQGARHQITYP
jgi:hypothetical protein